MADPRIPALHRDAPLTDLHCHPPLMLYLLPDKKLHEAHTVDDANNPFSFRCDVPSLMKGGVRVALATTHVPEKALLTDCKVIGAASPFVPRAQELFAGPPDEMTRRMMTAFEAAVAEAAKRKFPVTMAHSRDELKAALQRKKVVFLHAVEGGHSLRGKRRILDNLEDLFDRGVCLLTLAHFYDHQISPPSPGLPHDMLLSQLGCFRQALNPDPAIGLYPEGKAIVRHMLELGMIVDLSHTNARARQDVYAIWEKMPKTAQRPLVFSHAGLYNSRRKTHAKNPTPADLKMIRKTGGVVGIIFMNYWLAGKTLKGGADNMSHVVAAIHRLYADGYGDNVALGSDFDGFTDPPQGLKEPSDFPNLTDELLTGRRYGGPTYTPEQVKKFLGGNFMRVLDAGWGR